MSQRFPALTYRDLIEILRREGCEFYREAKGSHEVWWHPGKRLMTTVPKHGGNLDTGTVRKILRDLQMDPRSLRNLN